MNVLRQIVESPQADALGWCLVHAVWQVALLGAGLKLALAAADRHAARLRYHLGLAALAGSLLFPVITGYWMVSTAPSNVVSGMPRTSTATAAGNPPKTVISQDRDVTPRGPVADTASHGVATGRDQALVRGAGLPANRSAQPIMDVVDCLCLGDRSHRFFDSPGAGIHDHSSFAYDWPTAGRRLD